MLQKNFLKLKASSFSVASLNLDKYQINFTVLRLKNIRKKKVVRKKILTIFNGMIKLMYKAKNLMAGMTTACISFKII